MQIGVDPSTLARWERGEREPTGAFLERVKRFLHEGTKPARGARGRAGFGQLHRETIWTQHCGGPVAGYQKFTCSLAAAPSSSSSRLNIVP